MTKPSSRGFASAATPLVEADLSRASRRRRVVALYGGYVPIVPIYAIARAAHDRTIALVGLAILSICFAAFCYGFYTLMQRTFTNSANVEDEALDERQLERRNRAVFVAFRTLSVVLAVAPLWATIATTAERWTWLRDPSLIAFAAWSVFLLGLTLPTALLAWNEPDPIPTDAVA